MALVTMPKLSDTMEEGKILRWLKALGDPVAAGDLLVEVETDKADMEVESPHGGVLREIRLKEGESGPVGAVIAVIDGGSDEPAKRPHAARTSLAPRKEGAAPPPAARPPEAPSPVPPSKPGTPGSGVIQVRPPSRPAGRAPAGSPAGAVRVPLSSMRASIARRMSESKREAPHFYVDATVQMDLAVQLRETLRERGGDEAKVTYNHLVLKACADALAVHRELNARFVGDAIEMLPEINLGVATAVPEGLIVPVIRRADTLSLLELAARARELADRASRRDFGTEDLSGATFSVSNLGMYGVDGFAAVINPPHAGILAVGSVREQPVVRRGSLAVGHTLRLTLSCDHRAVDGVQAAKFLVDVRGRLEDPVRLFLGREREPEP